MLEALFKTLLAVIMLVIIVPLVLLLFGEGALAYKIFGWAFSENESQEVVVQQNTSTNTNDNTITFHQIDNSESRQTATVKHLYVDHNTYEEGKKGMTITVEFDTENLKDEDLYCLVRFYNDDGSPVAQEIYNEKYLSVNGNVIVGQYFSPSYNDCTTRIPLFMPYDELPTNDTDRTDYLMDASILHYHTETEYDVLERSNSYSFYLQNEP